MDASRTNVQNSVMNRNDTGCRSAKSRIDPPEKAPREKHCQTCTYLVECSQSTDSVKVSPRPPRLATAWRRRPTRRLGREARCGLHAWTGDAR